MSGPAPLAAPLATPLAAPGRTALSLWAGLAGLALWAPAVTLPGLALPLQPMDGLVLAGGPLLLVSLGRLPPGLLPVLGPGLLSIALSWAMNGGSPLVLGWSLAFALPFVALVALAAADARARGVLLGGFMLGAVLSVALFLAQILRGAEALDFRNNPAFRLPAQYGRGFALMPEVSTFAVHALIALGMVLAWLLAGRQAGARWVGRRGAIGQSSAPSSALSSAPSTALFPALLLAISLVVALALTRSTSVLVLLPMLVALALGGTSGGSVGRVTAPLRHPVSTFRNRRGRGPGWLGLLVITGALVLILAGFVQLFYAERLASASAERSASMRLASVLGGLTPLHRGELFGVGIGENAAVRLRAHEVARALGLRFGTLPEGVNSQIVGRLFEEGWPALLHLSLAAALLWRGWRRHRRSTAPDRGPDRVVTALWMLAWGGCLAALLVVGYRGIYTTWLWLGLVAGLGSAQAVAGRGPIPRPTPRLKHRPTPLLWPAT